MKVHKCVFCSKKGGRLNAFIETTLQKCDAVLKIRVAHGLAMSCTSLPQTLQDREVKYHSLCYQRFTALPPKYRAKPPAQVVPITSSEASSPNLENIRVAVDITSTNAETSASINAATSSSMPLAEASIVDKSSENEFAPIVQNQEQINQEKLLTDNEDLSSLEILDDTNEDVKQEKIKFSKKCCFCKKHRKKFKWSEEKLHEVVKSKTLDNFEKTARDLGHVEFEKELKLLRQSNNVAYHNRCKSAYDSQVALLNSAQREKTEWHKMREKHRKAYENVCRFVSENIIQQEQSYDLSFLHSMYLRFLNDGDLPSNSYFQPYHLKQKISKSFSKKIDIVLINGKRIVRRK